MTLTKFNHFKAENSNIKQVLQEKNRESGQMKAENARLLQSIADYKSKGDMAKETVQNLSSVIRDKDLEIDGLKSRNESLVILVQESTTGKNEPKLRILFENYGGKIKPNYFRSFILIFFVLTFS